MTIHEDIAKERYLDMVANGTPPAAAAQQAIEDATAFVFAYTAWVQKEREAAADARSQLAAIRFSDMTRGCPSCFGSGGKRSDPCQRCNGTGRISASGSGGKGLPCLTR